MRSTTVVSALFVAACAAPSLALPVAPAGGSEALNWYKVGNAAGAVGKTLLHSLREEDALMARGHAGSSEKINGRPPHPRPFGPARPWPVHSPRAAPAGSEAVNWKKVGSVAGTVGKTLLHFLREQDPIMARAFEEELLARGAAEAGSEAINWRKAGSVVGSVGKTLLHSLREEDPILARAFEEELLARAEGSEAINWHNVGHNAKEFGQGLIHGARADELIGRAEAQGSEAINWHKFGQNAKDFGKGLAQSVHSARADELIARAEAEGSEAINWHNIGHNAKDFGEGMIHGARGFVLNGLD